MSTESLFQNPMMTAEALGDEEISSNRHVSGNDAHRERQSSSHERIAVALNDPQLDLSDCELPMELSAFFD